MITFYDILGVARHASADDIRRAFRSEAKRLHPDTGSGTAAAMSRLNEAYETLKDPERRETYDQSQLRQPYRLPSRPASGEPARMDPAAYLVHVFHPLDQTLAHALRALHQAIVELAYDLYDDSYIAQFGQSVASSKEGLAMAYQVLMSVPWPGPFISALNLYRQGIRQADDAVEDFESFMLTLDSDTLVEGRSLLQWADEMLDEARTSLGTP